MPAYKLFAFSRILIAVFLAVAVLMFALAAISATNSALALSKETSVPGSVVDLVMRRDGADNVFYYPVVAFYLPDGSRQTIQLAEGSWPSAYQQDESVIVAYDPERPRKARIRSFSTTAAMWILPFTAVVLGVSFLVATLFARRVLGSSAEKARRSRASRAKKPPVV